MKTYTREQRDKAREKIPRPVSDFLNSDSILDIYTGLIQKHKLNWRQGGAMSELVNLTLLGLEQESALETNLHQALPELPAATLRELIEDINDRIFKEAQRRIKEQVVATAPEWDAAELGPKSESGKLPTDIELEAQAEKEKKEGWKPPEEEYIPPTTPPTEPGKADTTTPETLEVPIEKETSASIVSQKLSAPTQSKNEPATIKPKQSGIQNVSVPQKPSVSTELPAKEMPPEAGPVAQPHISETPATPVAPAPQTPAPTPPQTPIQNPVPTPPPPPTPAPTEHRGPSSYKGSDPYREPID